MKTDPDERRAWGRDGIIGCTVAAVVMAVYFALARGMNPALIPVIIIAGPLVGYVLGVARYNRHVFLRAMLSKLGMGRGHKD